MNENVPKDLFDLLNRWNIEVQEIPSYIRRNNGALTDKERRVLMYRRDLMRRLAEELRDTMAEMNAHYRGTVDGVVVVEADTEDECWAIIKDAGTVEFKLCTGWEVTDRSIEHDSHL